ncbi:hypothetical protein FRC11_005268 [Ceratobasidium sp. 423]|nr:hypothetical protein FRC11_005268 [Ceratobasidium sp. 423]
MLRENKLVTASGIPTNPVSSELPCKRGPGQPPTRRNPVGKGGGPKHDPSTPVALPRKYSIRWDPAKVEPYVQNWEPKGTLSAKAGPAQPDAAKQSESMRSSPEPTPASTSPGKNGTGNGSSPGGGGPSPQRAERERPVSPGSGMVHNGVLPFPLVVFNGVDPLNNPPAPDSTPTLPSILLPTVPPGDLALPFDDGSPLTSIKEELTNVASEEAIQQDDNNDGDLRGEDAEGEPDEDEEGEVDESIL